MDVQEACAGSRWLVSLNWWLRGRRPTRLQEFSERVVQACRGTRTDWLLSTGLAPVDAPALTAIGRLGVRRLNYLTDDPWNPAHRAPWFLEALPQYDGVFSPRRSNLEDLRRLGCASAVHLPFAYSPSLHFPEPPITPEEQGRFETDVVFAGGADRDRVPYIAALIRAGFRVGLYGGYWERWRQTRKHTRRLADPRMVRKAVGGARIALCLVRRANRDGHSMRTFEIPAIGGCMLTEDTAEHREIFGEEGRAVVYFRSVDEMVQKARWLLERDEERRRLAAAAHALVVNGRNTYQDRLETMLELARPRMASVAAASLGRAPGP